MRIFSLGITVGLAVALSFDASNADAAASCALISTSGVAFGAYDIFSSTDLDSTGAILYRCDGVPGAGVITIDLSRGNASSFFRRQLMMGTTTLQYNLYVDPARTLVWGDGSCGTAHYGPFTPTVGANGMISVYGRIPAHQNVHEGLYMDTVIVTFNY